MEEFNRILIRISRVINVKVTRLGVQLSEEEVYEFYDINKEFEEYLGEMNIIVK